MSWFHIPKKKIVLECVTPSEAVAKFAPIARAGKFLPDWWKDIARNPPTQAGIDMRGCAGMVDMYSHGFMIPMWSELHVTIGAKGTNAYAYKYADKRSFAEAHPATQRGSFLPETEYQHLKLVAPWYIQCDEDVKFIFMQPTWNFPVLGEFEVLTGIVDYKYQHSANINTMFTRKDGMEKVVILPFGQPIAHVVPLDPRPVDIKIIVDPERYAQLHDRGAPLSFRNAYKQKKAIAKAQDKKCPFN
jgi:hypothetical protein